MPSGWELFSMTSRKDSLLLELLNYLGEVTQVTACLLSPAASALPGLAVRWWMPDAKQRTAPRRSSSETDHPFGFHAVLISSTGPSFTPWTSPSRHLLASTTQTR